MSKAAPAFSIVDLIRAKAAGTWAKIDSYEHRAVCAMHEEHGLADSGMDLLPAAALASRATPLTTAGANGGYLVDGNAVQGYLPAFQAQTNLLRLGATQVLLERGATTTPRGLTALAPTWLTNETTATAETAPTFGQLTFARKNLLVSVRLSRQLLLQSDAENIVRTELVRACAAEIDKQGIVGTNTAGLPLGLLNVETIPTASGATLAYSSIVTQMTNVANSNAVVDPAALGFLTTPTVAGVLKQRQFSSAGFPIWTGSVPSGQIDLQTALSSTNVSVAGALIHGDFSRLLVASWQDGLQIDVDPFTQFQSAFVTIRLIVAVDFVIASPLSFSILTGVT